MNRELIEKEFDEKFPNVKCFSFNYGEDDNEKTCSDELKEFLFSKIEEAENEKEVYYNTLLEARDNSFGQYKESVENRIIQAEKGVLARVTVDYNEIIKMNDCNLDLNINCDHYYPDCDRCLGVRINKPENLSRILKLKTEEGK